MRVAACRSCRRQPRACAPACRGLLGYLHNVQGVPLDRLSFSAMLPSAGRDGVSVLFDYILWLHRERRISVLTEGLVVRSAAAVAKYLYHGESRVSAGRRSGGQGGCAALLRWLRADWTSCVRAAGQPLPGRAPLQRSGGGEGAARHEQRRKEAGQGGAAGGG